MNSITSFLVLAFLSTCTVAQFVIHTPPSAVVCTPLRITWTGGNGPYTLRVFPGRQPNNTVLFDLGQQTGTSFTWTVAAAAGSSLALNLRDSSQTVTWSAAFSVLSGSDTSCLGSTSPTPSSPAGNSTTGAGSGGTGTATGTGTAIGATGTATGTGTGTEAVTGSATGTAIGTGSETGSEIPTSVPAAGTETTGSGATDTVPGNGVPTAPSTTSGGSNSGASTTNSTAAPGASTPSHATTNAATHGVAVMISGVLALLT